MKIWQRLPLNILATAMLSGFSYVLLIAILTKGLGLGEPMWKGFLLQILLYTSFTFIALAALLVPVYILLNHLISSTAIARKMIVLFVFLVLILLYAFMLSLSDYWLSIFLPAAVGVTVFYFIEQATVTNG